MTERFRVDPDDFDESSARVRPNRRGSRPRSKQRPSHNDSMPGFVAGVDRGRYRVVLGSPSSPAASAPLTATLARELGRAGATVGDRVRVVGDLSGTPGSLARIVAIDERSSVLRRSADDRDATERMLVANADTMVIVAAAADPAPRPRLIDRCLVAAYDAGIGPILCVTKTDLADPTPLVERFAATGVEVVLSSLAAPGAERLRDLLERRLSVLVGPSGVGKSTLVNALVPGAERRTGHVNEVTGRGRHTSSSAQALPLGDPTSPAGWIVDTPGVRSFGLAHVDPGRVVEAFPELARLTDSCPPGCRHQEKDAGCGLLTLAADDPAAERRDSLRRLLASLDGVDEARD